MLFSKRTVSSRLSTIASGSSGSVISRRRDATTSLGKVAGWISESPEKNRTSNGKSLPQALVRH